MGTLAVRNIILISWFIFFLFPLRRDLPLRILLKSPAVVGHLRFPSPRRRGFSPRIRIARGDPRHQISFPVPSPIGSDASLLVRLARSAFFTFKGKSRGAREVEPPLQSAI